MENEATVKEVSVFVTKAGEVGSFFLLCVSSFVNFLINFMDFLLGENCAVQRCDSRCSAHGVCSNGESSFFTYNNVCTVLYNMLSCTYKVCSKGETSFFYLHQCC